LAAQLAERMDRVLQRLDALVLAAEFAALGPDRVVEFPFQDRLVRLHLPFATQDVLQGFLLRHRTFYEAMRRRSCCRCGRWCRRRAA
jgi:hypothetical protein